jgi:bifunctional non-homologous end joining protein LigD
LEGILAKDSRSQYQPDVRSSKWLKIKTRQTLSAVIVGYIKSENPARFKSLILALPYNGNFKYIGNVGSGFDAKLLILLKQKLDEIEAGSVFGEQLKIKDAKWTIPKYICEVAYTELTRDGILRQSSFQGLREDLDLSDLNKKDAPDVNMTKKQNEIVINNHTIKLTNLDKIFWPEEKLKKKDLVDYYYRISNYILPYLKDRPQSLNRFPDGINMNHFYQKNFDLPAPEWIKKEKIYTTQKDKGYIDYLLCQNTETLLFMANLGCIEINPWLSRIDKLDLPDFLVFDLDPLEIDFRYVIKTALEVKKVLDLRGIKSYCKTSGATGLHIYVPLKRKYDYEKIKNFAKIIAFEVNSRIPEFTSIERLPAKRNNKVYIDFLQNSRGQTIAAPYSLRPLPGAPVSTPLDWNEVNNTLDPRQLNINTIFKRLEQKGDLFSTVLSNGIDIYNFL